MAAIDEYQIKCPSESSEEGSLSQSLKQVAGEISVDNLEESCCSYLRSSTRQPFCLRTKSTSLILVWSFLAGIFHSVCTNPYFVITRSTERNVKLDVFVIGGVFTCYAFLQLFYPLAGLLADVRYGRYKCVIGSLWSFAGGSVVPSVIVLTLRYSPDYLKLDDHAWSYAVLSLELAVLGIPAIVGALFIIVSIIAFNANVVQFGLDQLYDSPTEHLVLYIRWYVLFSFIGYQVATLMTSICFYHDLGIVVFIVLAYVLLISSLCVGYRKRRTWFLTDSGSRNPYRLVYRVICFARKHTYPIRRSAFTYCEDELPSRLDLGKEKYGGPFTTEQVEDVKVFLGLLRVLLSLGPLFAVERSTFAVLSIFTIHLSGTFSLCIHSHPSLVPFVTNSILPSFLTICFMILYIIFLRHLLCNCFRGMLKRMTLGMALLIVPNICFFILDTVGHTHIRSHNVIGLGCFLVSPPTDHPLQINPLYLFIPLFCSSCGFVLFYIAVYDFLCAQSPHSMKGLLIGTLYVIRGIFQLLGALIIIFPFLGWRISSSFPSCGFAYYLVNIAIAVVGFAVFLYVAKSYKYRQRDEPDNVFRYAEEYYSKSS